MRLINSLNRPQAHRHRGELPVIRHQPRVRVRRQPIAIHFSAKIIELLFAQTAFQIRAGVDAGGTVSLKEHKITQSAVLVSSEEIVKAHIIQGGAGAKARNVSAQALVVIIPTHHHRQSVPARERANTTLHEQIPGHGLLFRNRDGIAERGCNCSG